MLRKSGFKTDKLYTLKKTPLKKGKSIGLKRTTLKKSYLESTKVILKKQNNKAKEKWEKIRNVVLIRDNYKCVICKNKATQVHHIHLRSKRKDLIYNLSNLVSLCDKCHCHSSTDNLEFVNKRIAFAKGITLEELLKQAENKEEN